jgi:hypothetical protein
VASLAEKLIVSAWLYQPLLSATRLALALRWVVWRRI